MTIEVAGCHDCPFRQCEYDTVKKYWCSHIHLQGIDIDYYVAKNTFHPSCPLQTESITIKKKDNETGR